MQSHCNAAVKQGEGGRLGRKNKNTPLPKGAWTRADYDVYETCSAGTISQLESSGLNK